MVNNKFSQSKIEIEIDARLDELARIALIVNEFGQYHAIPSKILYDIDLCIEEIVSNIIKYAYETAENHKIQINLDLVRDGVLIEVIDDGRAFNPLQVPEPDTRLPHEERPVGGFGLVLVRRFMDDLEYARTGECNHFLMKKRFNNRETSLTS